MLAIQAMLVLTGCDKIWTISRPLKGDDDVGLLREMSLWLGCALLIPGGYYSTKKEAPQWYGNKAKMLHGERASCIFLAEAIHSRCNRTGE